MSNKEDELKTDQKKSKTTSTELKPLKSGVFMMREKGQSFEDYQKAFVEALDRAGLLSPSKPEAKQEQGKEQIQE